MIYLLEIHTLHINLLNLQMLTTETFKHKTAFETIRDVFSEQPRSVAHPDVFLGPIVFLL